MKLNKYVVGFLVFGIILVIFANLYVIRDMPTSSNAYVMDSTVGFMFVICSLISSVIIYWEEKQNKKPKKSYKKYSEYEVALKRLEGYGAEPQSIKARSEKYFNEIRMKKVNEEIQIYKDLKLAKDFNAIFGESQ